MPKVLIGFTGNIGAGKTTAANFICNCFGFQHYNFADPIKKFALSVGFDEKNVNGCVAEKNAVNGRMGISGREFMRKFGTEICRDVLPKVMPTMGNIWIKAFDKAFIRCEKKGMVVGDVRFLDEAAAIKKNGGIVIRIERKSTDNNVSTHTSDTTLRQIEEDYTVENDGALSELQTKIMKIIVCHFFI